MAREKRLYTVAKSVAESEGMLTAAAWTIRGPSGEDGAPSIGGAQPFPVAAGLRRPYAISPVAQVSPRCGREQVHGVGEAARHDDPVVEDAVRPPRAPGDEVACSPGGGQRVDRESRGGIVRRLRPSLAPD